jgi:hypothetical protein
MATCQRRTSGGRQSERRRRTLWCRREAGLPCGAGRRPPPPEGTREQLRNQLGKRGWVSTEELAAYVAADRIHGPSLREGREFATLIVRRNGQYTFLDPIRGARKSVPQFREWFEDVRDKLPGNSRIVGWLHSHGVATEGYVHSEEFSGADRRITQDYGITGYLVTPSGHLLSLDPLSGITDSLGYVPAPGLPLHY